MRAWIILLSLFVIVSGCGDPDCPCEFPTTDAGTYDFFTEHYSKCVDMCVAAEEWKDACGHLPMRTDCVEWLWYRGITPEMCERAGKCYDVLTVADYCEKTVAMEVGEGWDPTVWTSCPVD